MDLFLKFSNDFISSFIIFISLRELTSGVIITAMKNLQKINSTIICNSELTKEYERR